MSPELPSRKPRHSAARQRYSQREPATPAPLVRATSRQGGGGGGVAAQACKARSVRAEVARSRRLRPTDSRQAMHTRASVVRQDGQGCASLTLSVPTHRVLKCRESRPAVALVLLAVWWAQPRASAGRADELPLACRAECGAARGAASGMIVEQRGWQRSVDGSLLSRLKLRIMPCARCSSSRSSLIRQASVL